MKTLLVGMGLLVSSLPAMAANFSPEQAISYLPAGHDLALIVADANNGKIIYQQRANKLQPPASTQKLMTSLAATLYLGKDFRFKTQLETEQNNVIIKFGGDPSFTRQNLYQLLQQLPTNGINQITGNIYLNGSVFDGETRQPGLPWDMLGQCYAAPASSITVAHNCVKGSLYSSNMLGGATRIYVPAYQPVHPSTNAITVNAAQKAAQFCDLQLNVNGNNDYHVSGCMVQRSTPLALNFAIQNTVKFTSHIIRADLQQLGIPFSGKIIVDNHKTGTVIATHRSAPLKDLLHHMLKVSDNLYADMIAKTVGAHYYHQSGNFLNGVSAIKAIIREKAGLTINNIMVDGSGLSRDDRITAHDLYELVSYIYKHNNTLQILPDLPIAGVDGTLHYRRSVQNPPLMGNLIAKTGTLYGTYNIAGLLTTKTGKKLIVVELMTNYPDHPNRGASGEPRLMKFEKAFYTGLYNAY